MNISYTSLEGKSRGYRLLEWVLGLLALAGLAAFGASYLQGHQLLGGSNSVPWGMPVVLAIYLIGLSAGSLIMSSLTYVWVMFLSARYLDEKISKKKIIGVALIIAGIIITHL